jgi:hypothetical protein
MKVTLVCALVVAAIISASYDEDIAVCNRRGYVQDRSLIRMMLRRLCMSLLRLQ